MTEKQVRQQTEERMNQYDVVISIPVTAGFFGDMEAISFFEAVKERMMEASNPLRATSPAPGGKGIKSFVYGESYKMKANKEYLDKFVKMATQFGEVQDILGMNY